MDEGKSTKFIRWEVDPDPSFMFEHRISGIIPSVIAFAYGTNEDGSPNIIGTGFSVGSIDGAGLFATCLHVAERMKEINILDAKGLNEEGLKDKKRCIALFKTDTFQWQEVGPIRFSDRIQIGERNFTKVHDVCICRIPEIILPPLPLSPNKYFIGRELGIIGFPVFDMLQRVSVQPYAIKTILSSHMMYPFERDGDKFESERLALGCIVGPGFSGSPVFSILDETIVGMVDYLPSEVYFGDIKFMKPFLYEADIRVAMPAGISLAVPSTRIKQCLDYCSKMNWEDPSL
jgi:hypothetical protein